MAYKLKAVFILNFLRFIEWPQSSFQNEHSPITLAIIGKDPFGKILDETIQNEKVNNHPVIIRRNVSVSDAGKFHVLYISESEKRNVNEIIKKVENTPALTISDIDGFGENGGIITFFIEDNKIRFMINIQSLKQAELKASSKLLRLAKIINP
ncbi:MAG: YfiR family protein [Ignavibacteriaceae bacterium]